MKNIYIIEFTDKEALSLIYFRCGVLHEAVENWAEVKE